jgi:hypothetical protein
MAKKKLKPKKFSRALCRGCHFYIKVYKSSDSSVFVRACACPYPHPWPHSDTECQSKNYLGPRKDWADIADELSYD